MSRSYKKHPISKDNGHSKKEMRTLANRTVRRRLNRQEDYTIANGKAYRKEFDSWCIADYVTRWTKQEAIDEYEKSDYVSKEMFPTLESFLNFWEKCMRRK